MGAVAGGQTESLQKKRPNMGLRGGNLQSATHGAENVHVVGQPVQSTLPRVGRHHTAASAGRRTWSTRTDGGATVARGNRFSEFLVVGPHIAASARQRTWLTWRISGANVVRSVPLSGPWVGHPRTAASAGPRTWPGQQPLMNPRHAPYANTFNGGGVPILKKTSTLPMTAVDDALD